MQKLLINLGLVVAVALLAMPGISQADYVVAPGFDLFKTDTAYLNLGSGPIPFEGVPLGTHDFGGLVGSAGTGDTDTIIQRIGEASVAGSGLSDEISIEIVALQLVSVVPIDVGEGSDYHYATLQTATASTGTVDITFDSEAGGFFDSIFTVYFDLRIGALDGPILFSGSKTFTSSGNPWARDPVDGLAVKILAANYLLKDGFVPDQDFWAPTAQHDAGDGSEHNVSTGKHYAIPTVSEWGMIVMTLLVVTAGVVVIRKRRLAV